MQQPPAVDPVNVALRYRRLQLAQQLLSRLGTGVRHGVFKGMDLGPDLLQREQPVARALGLAQAAWQAEALHLCQRQTRLLHLGAPDGYAACGLLHAGLVAGAWVEPASAEAAQHLQADAQRTGQDARLQPLAVHAANPIDPSVLQALAAQPHVLCLADRADTLWRWLEAAPADAWQRTTFCWPAGEDATPDAPALAVLRERLGPAAHWRRLQAPAPAAAEELLALSVTDRALLTSDAGDPAWWCVRMPAVAERRRTLLCTYAGDQFVARLLDTLRWDAFEPLAVDVLHYTNPKASGPAADPQFRTRQYPDGVRVFELSTSDSADGQRGFDPATPVFDARGQAGPAMADLADGYERFAVWSVDGLNSGLLRWLATRHGRERVAVLVSDNEIDLRWRALQYLASDNPELRAVGAQHHPQALEDTYDAVRHYVVARRPWETMLRHRRAADLEIHPCLLPIKNDLSPTRGVRPADDAYVLMLHPKPSLPAAEVTAHLHDFLARWQVDRPLRIITLRNDLASGSVPLPGGRQAQLRVYPHPMPEHMYFQLMAGCHGLVLVPRGGMTSIRDAIRLGLDIFHDGSAFSPNLITLRDELGLQVHDRDPITALHEGQVSPPAWRVGNQRRLANYERDAVTFLRNTFL